MHLKLDDYNIILLYFCIFCMCDIHHALMDVPGTLLSSTAQILCEIQDSSIVFEHFHFAGGHNSGF